MRELWIGDRVGCGDAEGAPSGGSVNGTGQSQTAPPKLRGKRDAGVGPQQNAPTCRQRLAVPEGSA